LVAGLLVRDRILGGNDVKNYTGAS